MQDIKMKSLVIFFVCILFGSMVIETAAMTRQEQYQKGLALITKAKTGMSPNHRDLEVLTKFATSPYWKSLEAEFGP